MIYTKTMQVPITLEIRQSSTDHSELNRLLAAAAVNTQFCRLLLDDPALALRTGYQGETFSLTEEERSLIQSIRADSIVDLSKELVRTFGQQLPPFMIRSACDFELLGR